MIFFLKPGMQRADQAPYFLRSLKAKLRCPLGSGVLIKRGNDGHVYIIEKSLRQLSSQGDM